MVLGYLFSYGYVLFVLLLAVIADKFKLLSQEGRRKLVHVLLVFTWVIMITYLKGTIHLIVIPASFVLLNTVSYLKAKKADGSAIPILSSMERSGEEETPGTVYYALSIMIMGIITLIDETWFIPCGIGLFCMAFGDGMAGVVGKKARGIFARHITGEKSLGGTLACIVFSIIGCELYLLLMGADPALAKILIVSVMCAVLELPGRGFDNLTVPFGSMLVASLLF